MTVLANKTLLSDFVSVFRLRIETQQVSIWYLSDSHFWNPGVRKPKECHWTGSCREELRAQITVLDEFFFFLIGG